MIFKRIIKNWIEIKKSDLRRSVKPHFKGDTFRFSSFRSGAETYLTIYHNDIVLEFSLELEQLDISINGVNIRDSLLLTDEAKKEIGDVLASEDLPTSIKNNKVAQLISNSLAK